MAFQIRKPLRTLVWTHGSPPFALYYRDGTRSVPVELQSFRPDPTGVLTGGAKKKTRRDTNVRPKTEWDSDAQEHDDERLRAHVRPRKVIREVGALNTPYTICTPKGAQAARLPVTRYSSSLKSETGSRSKSGCVTTRTREAIILCIFYWGSP